MKKLLKVRPFLFLLLIWLILFWPFFSKKLLPIPADIICGVYYPWLDYKWGYPVGVPVKNPLLSDIPSLLYPWRSFAIDQLKNGQFPLWNPYYFTGMPLLANFQSSVLSYANVFFLFLPKTLAWSWGVMLSPLLTMAVMYLFLRHKKLSEISSLLGAVVFSLSGFEIAWMEYNVHGHTALFLPLLLLIIDFFFENKKWTLFLLPFLVAFQIFSGYVPVVIYSYLVCLFYILFFYFLPQIKKRKIVWKKYFLLFLFWIIGLGISAIQLLPGYELTTLSIRKTDPLVSASNASYLPLKNLVTFIAPDFFGNPATGNYFGTAFYDNFYLFVGTGTLLLVIFSLFYLKKNKEILFWWGMIVFSLILCFRNPLGLFLEKLFFLSGGVASKALFITDFSLAILAGYGLNFFLNGNVNSRKKIYISIGVVMLFFGLTFISAVALKENFQIVAIRNLIIPFVVLVFSSAALFLMIKFSSSGLLKIFLLFIISSQFLYSAKKYLPFSKTELLFPTTPVIEFLKQKQTETKEPFRVELGEVIPQNFLMPYGIETTSGYDALLPKKTAEFLSLVQNGKIEDRISRVHLISNYDSPFFPLTNTKYILAKKMDKEGKYSPEGKPPDKFISNRYQLVFEDKTVGVYEDSKYLDRVNYYEAEEKITDLNILAENFQKNKRLSLKNGVEWKKYSPLEKSFNIVGGKSGYVVLLDSGFVGWQAFVNGKPTAIEEPMQTIKVPAGKNEVILKYQPKSFYWGKKISVLSFITLMVVGLFILLKHNENFFI